MIVRIQIDITRSQLLLQHNLLGIDMIKIKLAIFFIGAMLFSSAAKSATYQVIDSFEVRAWSNSTFLAPVSAAAINPDDCSLFNSYQFDSDSTNGNSELMKAIALTAQASGSKITLVIHGCVGVYPNDRPKVHGIWITK